MKQTQQMPAWVSWALMGIHSRSVAMAYLIIIAIIAIIIVPEGLMIGIYSVLVFAPMPFWYLFSIEWMDEHNAW